MFILYDNAEQEFKTFSMAELLEMINRDRMKCVMICHSEYKSLLNPLLVL